MSTPLLVLNLNVNGNKQADGDVQLNYTVTNNVMAAGATLTYQVNPNSNASTIATTPNAINGVQSGTSWTYTQPIFGVTQFSLPANGTFNGAKFNQVGFTLTISATGATTLSGTFVTTDGYQLKADSGGDNLSWTADDEPFPHAKPHHQKGASGKH